MARRKTETTGANHDHHDRGCHHGQTVVATMAHGGSHGQAMVASGRPAGFPSPLRFGVSFSFAGFCLGSSILGLLVFFCNLS